MSTFKSIDEAREFFTGDKFAAANGITIDELGEDSCLCSMDIRDDHRNAVGGVMGGVIFTLGDFAFAVASNNVHMTTVGQHVSISYLSGSRGKRLYARAKCRKDGKTTCVYNIDISDDLGRDVAQFIGTGYKL